MADGRWLMGEKTPEIFPESASCAVPMIGHHSLTIKHWRFRIASYTLSGKFMPFG